MGYTRGEGLILLRFLGINSILNILRMDLKEEWFILWCQTRITLFSRPKRSLVHHSLYMSSLMSLSHTTSLFTSSKLVGIRDGFLVGVRRSSPAYRLSSCPKIRIFQVSLQVSSLVCSSRVADMGVSNPLWYLAMSFGGRCPIEPSLVGAEGSDRASQSGSEVSSLVGVFRGIWVPVWPPRKEDCSGIHGVALLVVGLLQVN